MFPLYTTAATQILYKVQPEPADTGSWCFLWAVISFLALGLLTGKEALRLLQCLICSLKGMGQDGSRDTGAQGTAQPYFPQSLSNPTFPSPPLQYSQCCWYLLCAISTAIPNRCCSSLMGRISYMGHCNWGAEGGCKANTSNKYVF